jgi:sulfate adenylyltransferase (ADP) / ATP adenylyltransferase
MPDKEQQHRGNLVLEPGTLWKRASDQSESALACGALQSIATDYQFIEQNGIQFFVRSLTNLVRKDEEKKLQDRKTATSGKEINPFLPYEKDLFVADISDTHLCLLNKYNVVPNHLLIITRAFEEQEAWLSLQDFEALWATLAEIDGLAFYNGGKAAGASQRHKHLQLIPFPFIPSKTTIPIETTFASAQFQNFIGKIPHFSFIHAFVKFDFGWEISIKKAAKLTLEYYRKLIETVGLPFEGNRQTGAYNFLMTKKWMLLVPRSQESFESIAVNSLGFAGALLVRNQEQLELLKQYTPLTLLKKVAISYERHKA